MLRARITQVSSFAPNLRTNAWYRKSVPGRAKLHTRYRRNVPRQTRNCGSHIRPTVERRGTPKGDHSDDPPQSVERAETHPSGFPTAHFRPSSVSVMTDYPSIRRYMAQTDVQIPSTRQSHVGSLGQRLTSPSSPYPTPCPLSCPSLRCLRARKICAMNSHSVHRRVVVHQDKVRLCNRRLLPI